MKSQDKKPYLSDPPSQEVPSHGRCMAGGPQVWAGRLPQELSLLVVATLGQSSGPPLGG